MVTKSVDAAHAQPVSKSDFIIFHSTGQIAINDSPGKIYDLNLQQKLQSAILGITDYELTPYLYPPQTMAFFAPLAYFPLRTADTIWRACNAAFTFALLIALTYAGICRQRGALLCATFLLLSSNVWIGVMAMGQPTILMALGLLGYQLLAKNKHIVFASVLLVMTAFKPQLIVAPALYLLIIYGRNLWISMGAVVMIVMALCSLIFGSAIWPIYMNTIFATPHLLHMDMVMLMCNLRTVILLLLGEQYFSAINTLSILLWLVSIAATVWIAFRVRHQSEKIKELGLAWVVVAGCFFSPYLLAGSLILLVIPIGYLIKYTGLKGLFPVVIGLMVISWAERTFPITSSPYIWAPAQGLLLFWIGFCFVHEKRNG